MRADLRVRRGRSRGGVTSPQGIAAAILDFAGCTYRQLQFWVDNGVLPDQQPRAGSGNWRTYTRADCETAFACARLSELGAETSAFVLVGDVIAARPVDERGEVLVVEINGRCYRTAQEIRNASSEPAWVVPLCTFVGDEAPPVAANGAVATSAGGTAPPSP